MGSSFPNHKQPSDPFEQQLRQIRIAGMAQFDLFLSHNSQDKAQIEILAEKLLEDANLRCWLDVWSIPAATDWEKELQQAMQQCEAVAIAIGKNGWGRYHLAEAKLMIGRAQAEAGFKLVPVLLDGITPQEVPDEVLRQYFERTQCIAWAGHTDDDAIVRIGEFLKNAGLPPFPEGRPDLSSVRVRRDAKLWLAKHDPSNLYSGKKLEEARQLSEKYPGQFDDVMLRFLSASEKHERQRQKRRVWISVITAAVLAVATVSAFWSLWNEIEARRKAEASERDAKLNSAAGETFRGRFGRAKLILETIAMSDRAVDFEKWVAERHCAYPTKMGELGLYGLSSLALDPISGTLLGLSWNDSELVRIDPQSLQILEQSKGLDGYEDIVASGESNRFVGVGKALRVVGAESSFQLLPPVILPQGARSFWFSGQNMGLLVNKGSIRALRLKDGKIAIGEEILKVPSRTQGKASPNRELIALTEPEVDGESGSAGGTKGYFVRINAGEFDVQPIPRSNGILYPMGKELAAIRTDGSAFDLQQVGSTGTWRTRNIYFKPWPGLLTSLGKNVLIQEVGDSTHEAVSSLAVLERSSGKDLLDPFLSKEPIWAMACSGKDLFLTGQDGWIQRVNLDVNRVEVIPLDRPVLAPMGLPGGGSRRNEILLNWSYNLDGMAWKVDIASGSVSAVDVMDAVPYESENEEGIISHGAPFIADVSPDGRQLAMEADSGLWIVDLIADEQQSWRAGTLDMAKAAQRIIVDRAKRKITKINVHSPQNLRWISDELLVIHDSDGHAGLVNADKKTHQMAIEEEVISALSRQGLPLVSTLSGRIYRVDKNGQFTLFSKINNPAAVFALGNSEEFFVASMRAPARTAFLAKRGTELLEVASVVGPGEPIDAGIVGTSLVIVYSGHVRVYHGWPP